MTQDEVNKAHAQIPSIQVGIQKLKEYSKQLEEINKIGESRVDRLSESHKDQNFKNYEAEFNKFWPTLKGFKGKNDDYIVYLQGLIKFIEEEYEKIKFGQ